MAAELPRPGVEVVQVFRTVTPTVVTPTLVPCVVGVGKQIVELIEQDASGSSVLNGDALLQLPAFFLAKVATGSPPVYTGLDGLSLVFSVNNGAAVTALFADPSAAGLTPVSVVTQVNAALEAAGVTSARAEAVGTTRWRLRTLAVGEFQSIHIDASSSPAALTAFGFGAGRSNSGLTQYNQLQVDVPPTNFPDPRGNIEELAVEASTIRLFLAISASNFKEVLRTESFLRKGVVDLAAQVVGTVDLTGLTLPADVTGLTLLIAIDGGTSQTVTFTGGASNPANLVGEINTQTTGLVATIQATTNFLVITSDAGGSTSSVSLGAGTSNSVLGLTTGQSDSGESVAVIDDGNGDNFSALLQFTGHDFTAAGTAAAVTGSVDLTGLSLPGDLTGLSLSLSDGQQVQTITFDATNAANPTAVLAAINGVLAPAAGGKLTATLSGGNALVLTHADTGDQSLVYVVGGTAASVLGLTVGRTYGAPGHVAVGDELWVDGDLAGTVTQVAPGGAVDVLKLDNMKVIDAGFGRAFYLVAKNLSMPPASDRPYPDLVVDTSQNVYVKHSFLRDTEGNALELVAARAAMYLTYTAVRRDLSRAAANPGLLRFDSQEQLESVLSPISAQNPLALGLFFALVNAPGVQVTGLGVDEISADAPFGTPESFERAAEFLEAFEVYALAPLTHDPTVGQIFNTHVSFMSEPEQKGERIVLFNPARPANELDELVASGNGDSFGSAGTQFDTKVPNLSALLLAQGVNPVGTIPTSAGVFLDIASDAKSYSISGVSGSVVTIRTSFGAGENDDGFYATTDLNDAPLPSLLINEVYAVRVRGAALQLPDGTVDKQKIAETYQLLGQSFKNRRFWMTAPDSAAATLQGLEQVVEGFYVNAATAGMIGQQPPQQSFTNFPITGFTRVLGSTEFFSERQLNIMAAGGTYTYVQDGRGLPLIARHALTTDLTSIEQRTDSINKVVDYTAKFLRRGLKNFIGRFNITQAFLDELGSVTNGLGGFLVEAGILIGFNLNNIIQDEDAPDTVLIDVLLDIPYPCNYIRLTLVI